MTKTKLLSQMTSDPERRLLLARILDKKELAEKKRQPVWSGFLSPEEQSAVEDLLRRLGTEEAVFVGGYPEAERKICVFLPEFLIKEVFLEEEKEICLAVLDVKIPPLVSLGHRDYLGSLMGLGLTREKMGDILIAEEGCQVVLLREVLPILESQWTQVGRHPISLREISFDELKRPNVQVQKIWDTVASLRMDAVVASGFSLSRKRAAELIVSGRVFCNHRLCEKTDGSVKAGDIISARGLGKFVLTECDQKSKKGRTIVGIERYT